jgi:putative tricarboxylic transport membrane protein
MEALSLMLEHMMVAVRPENLLVTFIGVFLGTILGILPGIGPAGGIVLLVPLTYGMDPTAALIMMCGIYYGAQYGGSATAILINTPGEASAVMTCLDGYQMARRGRAGAALAIAAWASFIAGTLSVVALAFLMVPLTGFALRFGPTEYFALMFFSLSAVSVLSQKSPGKAIFATMLGLMIATVGTDLQSSARRFTMGVPELLDGIEFPLVAIGLFAVGEVLINLENLSRGNPSLQRISGSLWLTRDEWKRSLGPIFRGGVIGFIFGVLPGVGGTASAIASYATERKLSNRPETFGAGAIEGVAGPEAANNASSSGSLVPMLTLGLPSGTTTGLMLGVLIMLGLQPGPLLVINRPDLVWGVVNSMYIGNVILLVLNLPLIYLLVRILYIPGGLLMPMVFVFSVIGVYSLSGNILDVQIMLFFGCMGYLFQKAEIPLAPIILGLVLGDQMEQNYRKMLAFSGGDATVVFDSGIAATLIAAGTALLLLPLLPRVRGLFGWVRNEETT